MVGQKIVRILKADKMWVGGEAPYLPFAPLSELGPPQKTGQKARFSDPGRTKTLCVTSGGKRGPFS